MSGFRLMATCNHKERQGPHEVVDKYFCCECSHRRRLFEGLNENSPEEGVFKRSFLTVRLVLVETVQSVFFTV